MAGRRVEEDGQLTPEAEVLRPPADVEADRRLPRARLAAVDEDLSFP
jgi:hypothetical protein